jgi:catechol 2,3-dioxygenase-like lactoylglutathione lyase family enzyme
MSTRATLRLLLGALLLVAAARAAGAEGPVRAVGAIGITVSDLDRAVAFYRGVLGFEKVSEEEAAGDAVERLQGVFALRLRIARLRLGSEEIELAEYLAPRGRPLPEDSRPDDHWFQHLAIVVRDIDRAYGLLREQRVEHASPGPQRLPDWNPAAGGIRAFYFRDPDGHFLELIQFPPGKGDPRWHVPGEALFQGIDHTAIVVADTDASLRFYRDGLGLRPAGASENHGIEQERLNGVFGARLRITTLRAPSGPGIELLEYLAPRRGRPRPADARANDLLHWQTDLVVADAERLAPRLRSHGGAWMSPGPVELGGALGLGRAQLVADPDGHGVRVVEGR